MPKIISSLRAVWIVAILYGEWASYRVKVRRCRFPRKTKDKKRLVVLTDHQLIDETSYEGRAAWARKVTIWVSDVYARRAFEAVDRLTSRDGYLFLGDYMDGGYQLSETSYAESLRRFNAIFPRKGLDILYAPGNHDVGLSRDDQRDLTHPEARLRFQKHFGPPNRVQRLGDYDIIVIDAIALAEGEQRMPSTEENWLGSLDAMTAHQRETIEFLSNLRTNEDRPGRPRILLSHIPLWRPLAHYCGPDRESRQGIRQFYGENYQNMLRKGTTQTLLNWIKPSLIFTGDDHDACFHRHPPNDVPEYTVKAFSMAMGIDKPGFAVLDLGSAGAAQVTLCLLPNQIKIYTHLYLPLFVVTALVLATWHAGLRRLSSAQLPLPFRMEPKQRLNGSYRLNGHTSASKIPIYSSRSLTQPKLLSGRPGRWLSNLVRTVSSFLLMLSQVAWPPVLVFCLLAWWSLP